MPHDELGLTVLMAGTTLAFPSSAPVIAESILIRKVDDVIYSIINLVDLIRIQNCLYQCY